MSWIDIEDERPPAGARVIILIPFGLRVRDDTWDGERWLNTEAYVSHWQPINAPGSYTEIMNRPMKREPLPVPEKGEKPKDPWFSKAVEEHFEMMGSLIWTQFCYRWEKYYPSTKEGGETCQS